MLILQRDLSEHLKTIYIGDWIPQSKIKLIGSSIQITLLNKQISTEHSVTQIKLAEAANKENHLWVNWHLQNNAKSNRQLFELKAGDMVRVHIKPKLGAKGHEPKWSSTRHIVIRIDDNKLLTDYIPKK